MPNQSNSFYKNILKFNHFTFNQLLQKFYEKFYELSYLNLNLIQPYSINFYAGNQSKKTRVNAKKNVPINLCDYDQYVKVKNDIKEGEEAKKYAVFLDINLPYQRDLSYLNLPKIEPKLYFDALNAFFIKIEEKFNISVVISSHPKSNYAKRTFLNRRIIKLDTASLVKNSSFVISHHSTSISYAVLFNKPILFIYTNEMIRLYRKNIIEEINYIANFFKLDPVNIDNISDCEILIPKINTNKYIEYKYKYITSKKTELTESFNIITKNLKKFLL